jgi:CBS domain-containing protein
MQQAEQNAGRDFIDFAGARPPFDRLPPEVMSTLAIEVTRLCFAPGAAIYRAGDPMEALYLIHRGSVEMLAPGAHQPSVLGPGDFFGARSVLRTGRGATDATAIQRSELFAIPAALARTLCADHPHLGRFFDRARAQTAEGPRHADPLLSARISTLMTPNPITVAPDATVRQAARLIRDHDVSCLPVAAEGRLLGILTSGDLCDRVLAEEGRDAEALVSAVMTPDPLTVQADGLGFDALVLMTERRISHLPVTDQGRLAGILTSTNLVRRQAVSAVFLVGDIAQRDRFEDFAEIVARVPAVLAQLVGSGVGAYDVGRIITTVSDALTRRLVALAERRLGPAPVRWCWAACGSQGRREQTGVSDQDNCLILDDTFDPALHGAYFTELARFVSDGLHAAGYFYCPGDMMATNDRWRQPMSVWRGYFRKWIGKPDDEARMLASVMFDLRAIAGEGALLDALQAETLEAAKKNSIFRAHMVRNSLKHQPPLGMFRGLALIRSGEHKDSIDMKHAGVVPIVDLGRLYALASGLRPVNTRDRLEAARANGTISEAGARDLLDAYDLIAGMRLEHQARLIREGRKPDNFMPPAGLSDLERNHLKDAFQVVKTMQAAAANALSGGS